MQKGPANRAFLGLVRLRSAASWRPWRRAVARTRRYFTLTTWYPVPLTVLT
jgi:hypothetical protein